MPHMDSSARRRRRLAGLGRAFAQLSHGVHSGTGVLLMSIIAHSSQAYNLTERLQLVALPPERYKSLPPLEARTSYLHTLGPWQGLSKGT